MAEAFVDTYGGEVADIIMEHLPPSGWSDLATRRDIADASMVLRADMSDLRAELRGEMADLRSELRGEMAELRAELKIEMAEGFQRQIKWMVGSMIGLFTAFSAVAGVMNDPMIAPDLADRLKLLSRAQKWEEMPQHIDDEVLHTFVTIGTYDEIGRKLTERFGNCVTDIEFSIAVKTPEDRERLGALAAARALKDYEPDPEVLARRAMAIAAELCVYTNDNLTVESLDSADA